MRNVVSSVDAHHAAIAVTDTADAPGARGSVDAHHVADALAATTIALMSYNLGIQNLEPNNAKNWAANIYETPRRCQVCVRQ